MIAHFEEKVHLLPTPPSPVSHFFDIFCFLAADCNFTLFSVHVYVILIVCFQCSTPSHWMQCCLDRLLRKWLYSQCERHVRRIRKQLRWSLVHSVLIGLSIQLWVHCDEMLCAKFPEMLVVFTIFLPLARKKNFSQVKFLFLCFNNVTSITLCFFFRPPS